MDQSIEYFKKTFRENLKQYRETVGYTQVELSEKSGFEASYIGKLERGDADPSLESIERICETLELKPEDLLLRKDDKQFDSGDTDEKLQVHEVELEMQKEQLIQTEAKLRSLRDRYRQLFQVAPVAFLTLDEDGQIIEANRAFIKTFAADYSSIHGSHVNEFVHADDRDELYRFRNRVIHEESPEPITIRLMAMNGKNQTYSVNSVRLDMMDDGDPSILFSFQATEEPTD